MSARLRFHIRSNVIGYLALFVALSGSAYAVTAPRNSVGSKSIKNGQVKSLDLQDNGVAGVDLQDNGVESRDIQDGGVQSVDLANGAVQSKNLAASAIGSPGFAKVLSNGNVFFSRGITGMDHTNGSGKYCITTSFAPQVAVATTDAGLGFGTAAQVQIPGGFGGAGCNPNEIAVITGTTSPVTTQDEAFYIVIE